MIDKKINQLLNDSDVINYINNVLDSENINDFRKDLNNNIDYFDFDENTVASSIELLQYFTSVMRDENVKSNERLKAGELLAKIYCLFNGVDKNNNSNESVNIIDDINY